MNTYRIENITTGQTGSGAVMEESQALEAARLAVTEDGQPREVWEIAENGDEYLQAVVREDGVSRV